MPDDMPERSGTHLGTCLLAVCILLGTTAAMSQVRVGVGVAVPGVSIGINIPSYPELVPVPGYPVYYAPQLGVNLFFYDGLYWAYAGDSWYYSSWYGGPWYLVQPELVPDFILRVPIRYYRRPPPYFLHWNRQRPPRWGEHWGHAWERRRPGWDRWNHAAVPPRAPLPGFQRQYPRGRYPDSERQRLLENRYYHYSPRDPRDRSRLPSPQRGHRLVPQPARPAPQHRHPERPPQAHRTPPGAMQRPGLNRPPSHTGQPRPDASRRPGAQPPRQHADSRRPRQQRDQGQPHGQRGNAHRQNQRPPG